MKIEELYKIFTSSKGISTDTRNLPIGCLYFALKGPNFDANSFAAEAIEKGASYAIIDNPKYQTDKTILVDDSLTCLQDLARFHRRQLKFPIIGLTGSNGKTTTKELIFNVLSQSYKVKATKGNLNNHIGVAITILSFNYNLDYGIVEMGANHQKEISFLTTISQPDFGLITNFGKAHLEGFGGVEGVIKGKTELYDFLKNNNKTIFVNTDDHLQLQQIRNYQNISTFGSSKSNDCVVSLMASQPFVELQYSEQILKTNLVGSYNFNNISAAIAIGQYFKVPTKQIMAGIESYTPKNNRSEIVEKKSNKILLDAYNANPTSMMAALENFLLIPERNKYLILGDMFELGEEALKEHQTIAYFASNNYKGPIFLVGENFYATKPNNNVIKFKNFEALKSYIEQNRITNAYLLIKGSRGMGLERILKYL